MLRTPEVTLAERRSNENRQRTESLGGWTLEVRHRGVSGGSRRTGYATRDKPSRSKVGREGIGSWETAITKRPDVALGNPKKRGSGSQVFGALDLGTNNCRLLVAKPARNGYRVMDTFSRVVRLGEGLSQSDCLSDAAIERTLQALKICSGKMRRLGVTKARCVATEACRRASNYDAFRDVVEGELGLRLELISSYQETQLAVYGCAPLFDPAVETALVFDIGGGSTEVCWVALPGHERDVQKARAEDDAAQSFESGNARGGSKSSSVNGEKWQVGGAVPGRCGLETKAPAPDQPRLLAWKSLPMGVTSLAERYGGGDISEACYERMVADVLEAVAPFERQHGISGSVQGQKVQMLGTSGTVTTLVGIKKELARYDRRRVDGAYLTRDAIEGLNRRVAAMSYDERAAHPCIGRQRADLVVAGCAILDALCRTWPVERLRVADRGLREGIIFTLMRGIAT